MGSLRKTIFHPLSFGLIEKKNLIYMNWEGNKLIIDQNQGIEILKCEAILISFDCCVISSIICFHPIIEKHNGVEYP
jgi:hypothetical protein